MRSKKKISLSVDEGVYTVFKDYCYQNGMKVSTKIEQLIKDMMNKNV